VGIGGSSWGRSALPYRRKAIAIGAGLLLALALVSCGRSSPGPPANTAPSNVLRPAELTRYEEGSVERTFLEYWSDLQFQAWADVAAYYDPRFRDFIGTAALIDAKKVGATFYPSLKPTIERVTDGQEEASVYYSLRREDGTKELASTTWRRSDGGWRMIHDSRLDAELNQAAQERVQLTAGGGEAGSTAEGSPEALRAGKAASRLQSLFLEEIDQG
jgi:hypothetical protein